MTMVTTVAQGAAAMGQPHMFEASYLDSDQESEARAFEFFYVLPVTGW